MTQEINTNLLLLNNFKFVFFFLWVLLVGSRYYIDAVNQFQNMCSV